MSKVSEAKKYQGYDSKPVFGICSNCEHYKSEITERKAHFGGTYKDERMQRCGIGGFKINKTSTCDNHEFKQEG